MHVRGLHRAAFVLLLSAWMVRPAAADPVHVTGGSLEILRPDGVLSLTGERGFTLNGIVNTSFGAWGPELSGCVFGSCLGVQSVSLGALWSDTDIRSGSASLDGWSGPLSALEATAYVEFRAGELVLPTVGTQILTFVAPFTFAGTLGRSQIGMPDAELVGNGWATVWLTPTAIQGTPLWRIDQMRYEFTPDPIPEPSTLILVGGAAVTLAARRLRSRRRRE